MCFTIIEFIAYSVLLLGTGCVLTYLVENLRVPPDPFQSWDPVGLVQCPRCFGLGLVRGDPFGCLCPHCGRAFPEDNCSRHEV